MSVQISVNKDLCMENGQCVAAAPDLFSLTDDGELLVLYASVPDALIDKAEQAVRLCPTQALQIDRKN